MIEVVKEEGLTKTGLMVYQLLQMLLQEPGYYAVYFDNYFTSTSLFKWLYNIGIRACGITCPLASPQFHLTLAILKELALTTK